ncbi:MAG: terminase large subunit domain-containing protein [Cypionkella sp.]
MTAQMSAAEWEEARQAAVASIPDEVKAGGLPKVLLPYQARTLGLLDSVCPVLFVEKSRRIGLTWGLAAYAVIRAGRQKAAGGMDVMYISYSREMTREFIDACAMWAKAFDIAAGSAEETLFDQGDDEKAINAFRIKFASGFEIMALSSAPRGLRGKQGVVIIDEAAFVDNLKELLKAALAFLMWGGQVVVCSTHDGADNDFNVAVQDILAGRSKFAHVRIDFDGALKEGLYQRICLVTGKEWSPKAEAEWRQSIIDFYGDGADEELFCIPSLTSGSWLPAPLIEARMTVDTPVLRLELPKDYLYRDHLAQASLMAPFMEELTEQLKEIDLGPQFAFGSDFARVADLTTGSLMAIEERLKRREVLAYELRGVPGDEQKLIAKTVLNRVRGRLVGAAFDATGMGWTVAEDMGRIFGLREDPEGSGLIWAIKFTEEWYRLHMPPLKAAFEDDQIALIRDNDHLSDLRAIKVVRGIARLPQLREGDTGKKRHGDHAIAVVLGHFASRMRCVEYGYEPVPTILSPATEGRMKLMPDDDDGYRDPYRAPLGAALRGGI